MTPRKFFVGRAIGFIVVLVILGIVGLYSHFTKVESQVPPSSTSTTTEELPQAPLGDTGGCFVGGCSGEICSDDQSAVSSCIYREAFACYKTASCARQSNGQCGWTQTPELLSCLGA